VQIEQITRNVLTRLGGPVTSTDPG